MPTRNHIPAPTTRFDVRAQDLLRERGDELLADLAVHVELVELQLPLAHRELARDRLVDFCTGRVVGHLLVLERVLYTAAGGAVETRLLARALRIQHDLVAVRLAELLRADSSAEVAASARALLGLLQVCHHVEQQVLIPALVKLPGVDLTVLADDVDALLARNVLDVPDELDTDGIPAARRHPRIVGTYLEADADAWRVQIGCLPAGA